MDFSKLSEETMELSAKIGPRQQKLLFDQEFYDDEVTFHKADDAVFDENDHSHENVTIPTKHDQGPGIAFFVDIGSGSFCVRGLPVVENNLSKEDLVSLNKHFEKASDIQFFPCESIEVAEVISEQMINRRYPLEDNGLVNISDPGATWLIKYDDHSLALYFKSINVADRAIENIGAIGDPQIFRFWWSKISSQMHQSIGLSIEEDEKGCQMILRDHNNELAVEYFQMMLKVLLLGEFSLLEGYFDNIFEQQNINTFLNELSHSRRFWLKIEEILVNS